MADKKEEKFDSYEERVEHDRAEMAVPFAERKAWAVFDSESGSYMCQSVFLKEEDAEAFVDRLLSKRNPSGYDASQHVFIAELSSARKKWLESREKASKK